MIQSWRESTHMTRSFFFREPFRLTLARFDSQRVLFGYAGKQENSR